MPSVLDTLLHILGLRTALQVRRIDAECVVAQVHDDSLGCDALAFVESLHAGAMSRDLADLALARAGLVAHRQPAVQHAAAVAIDFAHPYPARLVSVRRHVAETTVGNQALTEIGVFTCHRIYPPDLLTKPSIYFNLVPAVKSFITYMEIHNVP